MASILVTFGQAHAHRVNGKTFDKDSVARIKCESHVQGRKRAFELFDGKFFTTYNETGEGALSADDITRYFPRGIIDVE